MFVFNFFISSRLYSTEICCTPESSHVDIHQLHSHFLFKIYSDCSVVMLTRQKCWGRGQNSEAKVKSNHEAEAKAKSSRLRPRPRPATCRYFLIRTHGDNAKNTNDEFEFVSRIRALNHVFVMNVEMIQQRNGYNQYYFALDGTFFEAQVNKKDEAKCLSLKLSPTCRGWGWSRGQNFDLEPVWPWGLNITAVLWCSRVNLTINVGQCCC